MGWGEGGGPGKGRECGMSGDPLEGRDQAGRRPPLMYRVSGLGTGTGPPRKPQPGAQAPASHDCVGVPDCKGRG